jgi:hypothetical protein
MIFPYKEVGYSCTRPCGEKVYFLTRFIIRETEGGLEILEVQPSGEGGGLMRDVASSRVIATADEVAFYPEKVELADRALLIGLASRSGKRCTVFLGLDEHLLFVCDPDESVLETIHVFDSVPPRPALSAAITEIERIGLFGHLGVRFEHHVEDITGKGAEVYPCRAAGFTKTLDADRMKGGERVACCMTGAQLYRELWGDRFVQEDICPLNRIDREPFIARCCRSERGGTGEWHGWFGTIVHWGASPEEVRSAVVDLVKAWEERRAAKHSRC